VKRCTQNRFRGKKRLQTPRRKGGGKTKLPPRDVGEVPNWPSVEKPHARGSGGKKHGLGTIPGQIDNKLQWRKVQPSPVKKGEVVQRARPDNDTIGALMDGGDRDNGTKNIGREVWSRGKLCMGARGVVGN